MMNATYTSARRPGRLRGLLAALLCGLLLLAVSGCDSSDDDNGPIDAGPYPVNTGGFLVQLSAADLAELYPDPAALPDVELDPEVTQFTVFVFDLQNQLVASLNVAYPADTPLSATIDGLPITQYRVVLAALDGDGDLLGAARTPFVFPLAGGLQELGAADFAPLAGFVLP
jgi:hypothetical protein